MTPGTGWIPDDAFLNRVKRAYRLSIEGWSGVNHYFWGRIYDRQKPIHEALLDQDNSKLRAIFTNPAATDIFYGVDNLSAEFVATAAKRIETQDGFASESEGLLMKIGRTMDAGTDVLTALDKQFSARIEFPNPFRGEFGLPTDRGVASYRSIQSVYQALRIKQLLPKGGRVLEIGPGMGRTAFYAFRSGITDYATIDLPMGVVAQSCFLAASLGVDKIWMFGDDEMTKEGRIRLFPSSKQLPDGRFDLVINVDSLTEMSNSAAEKYVTWIAGHAPMFLSINHSQNDFTALDVCDRIFVIKDHVAQPYVLRDGYSEEIFYIGPKRWPLRNWIGRVRYWIRRGARSLAYRAARIGRRFTFFVEEHKDSS